MSMISPGYLIFIFLLLIVFFSVPKKHQWIVLLSASLLFYILSDKFNIAYLLATSATIFFSAIGIEHISEKQEEYIRQNKASLTNDEKKAYKKVTLSKRRWIVAAAVIFNIGLLCVFKYIHFAVAQINLISLSLGGRGVNVAIDLIAPLGISFYTFQSIGYLLDVYWGKVKAEHNYAKMLLFISFFPQIIQGPISNFTKLSEQLFKEHQFTYRSYSRGAQRMLWGLFKKMVIANTVAPCTSLFLSEFDSYSSVSTFIGVILYVIQLYADFSGYMDISCGVCEMLDIRLSENFDRPFFSRSISEFWRRWHITLGAWFKNYIFFPVAVSKWNTSLSNWGKKKYGKFFGQALLATIPLTVVWLITGLWHGASWAYIVWGGINGLIIIFSQWMEPVYSFIRQKLKINESSKLWHCFQSLRTVLIFSFIEILPETDTLRDGFRLWRHAFTGSTLPHSFGELFPFVESSQYPYFAVALLGICIMLAFEILQRKKSVRERLSGLPLIIRLSLLVCLFVVIATVGVYSSIGNGGFMYANF